MGARLRGTRARARARIIEGAVADEQVRQHRLAAGAEGTKTRIEISAYRISERYGFAIQIYEDDADAPRIIILGELLRCRYRIRTDEEANANAVFMQVEGAPAAGAPADEDVARMLKRAKLLATVYAFREVITHRVQARSGRPFARPFALQLLYTDVEGSVGALDEAFRREEDIYAGYVEVLQDLFALCRVQELGTGILEGAGDDTRPLLEDLFAEVSGNVVFAAFECRQ